MFDSLLGTIISGDEVTASAFLMATVCSLLLGLFMAFMFSIKKRFSPSFLITLALLPATVQLVIMLVNGNLGAGLAVAGAFSLVRFRSAPGSSQEIAGIFIAMAVGFANGMGYLGIACLFAVVVTFLSLLLTRVWLGSTKGEQLLKITIPENLDFEGVFDDVFEKYTRQNELIKVKTDALGSLYKLTYNVVLKENASVKDMIDEIRIRNGNLEISCGRPILKSSDL